jgi:hypothetical protein
MVAKAGSSSYLVNGYRLSGQSMSAFEVTKEIVGRLSDEQLRQLLGKLLEAEARARGIPLSGIALGGNQTAGDGGVDGSIVWEGALEPSGWLPRQRIYFQCKAEAMGPGKLAPEMRPKALPRPIFAELAKADGAYIVFTTDDPSKSAYDKRIAAMRAALADVPDGEKIALDFYGADPIARWTNVHPGVALWLLEQSGRPLSGWRPYGAWSAPDSADQLYLFDETARATIDGHELPMQEAIATMRALLAQPGGVVRLVGLSGMGKTRLAEALFDDRLDEAAALPRERAIYGDAGLDLAIGPALLAEQIAVSGIDAVIVVDNCAQRTHGQMAESVRKATSRASLLTIDYDVLGEQLAGTLVMLGSNSEDILRGVLKQRFPNLSDSEQRHLADFSGGNARIALKIAEAGGKGVDLSKLKDSELLDRLFQSGRQQADPKARDCAEAASLVHAFYVAEGREHGPEYPVLASLGEVSPQQFYRVIATFLEWGVIQQRGPQRAVMPPPLANMLAAPCIRRNDPDLLIAAFAKGPARLFASFARRIGQLHDEPAAVAIAERLFAAGGLLGNSADLDADRHRAFLNAAPASPNAALSAIERTLAGSDSALMLEPSERRRDLCQLLILIGHEERYFTRAIEGLLAFTLADRDTREELRGRSYLLERFWPVLSFTLADKDTRLLSIDRMLGDEDDRVRALGVEALDHMLDAGHFSSSLNLEFGARVRLKEWRPGNGGGYQPWFDAAYDRLITVAASGRPEAGRARTVIAEHFREHYDSKIVDKTLEAMRAVRGNTYWEAGWRAVNDTLHFIQRRTASEDPEGAKKVETLLALERDLHPASIDELFETFVLGEPYRHWHPAGRERKFVRNAQAIARGVGRALMGKGTALAPYLDQAAASQGTTSVWPFMQGLAWSAQDLDALWDETYARYIATDNPDPGLLAGILAGASVKRRDWVEGKLDAIMIDPALHDELVILQCAVSLDAAAIRRFSAALAAGTISAKHFSRLMLGGATKPLPGDVLADFLRELFVQEDGMVPALQTLHMRMFGDRIDKKPIDPALIALGSEMLRDPRIYTHDLRREDHGVAEIAQAVFGARKDPDLARAICVAMRENVGNAYVSSRDFSGLAALIRQRYPLIVYKEIVEKSTSDELIERFFGDLADQDDDKANEPEEGVADLLKWVQQNPQARALKVAHVVRYTVKGADDQLRWSAVALALVDLAPDPVPLLRAFENRFWSGAGWGPFSLRFVRRRPLLAAMLDHSDPRVQSWAREAGSRLEESIARWDKSDRLEDSLFE